MSSESTDPKDWAPSESAADLTSERLGFAGVFIGAVAFGVHLTLFIWCCQTIYNKKRKTRYDWYKLAYIMTVFTLSNIGNATYIKFAQMSWIDNRNYPGGPNAYFLEQDSLLVPALCNGAYIVATWFQDSLLLYRLWVIYGGNRIVVIPPSLMFVASVVLSILLLVVLVQPGITFHSDVSVDIGTPYWAISFASNVYITLLIAGRLLMMRRRLRKYGMGGSIYLSVAAVLVESAAIYTISGVLFIVPFALKSAVQDLWLPLLGQTQSIAPLLVILRSLLGSAWTSQTAADLGATRSGTDVQSDLSTFIAGRQTKTTIEALPSMKTERSLIAQVEV